MESREVYDAYSRAWNVHDVGERRELLERIERATAGMPSCVAKQVTRPIRNREAPVTEPHLE